MTPSGDHQEWSFGGTHLQLEPPKLLVLRQIGDLDVQDLTRLLDIFDHVNKDHGKLCLLADYRQATPLSAEARSVLSARGEIPFRAVAIYGASFAVSTLSRLVTKGLALFGVVKYPLSVHQTEAEARAWLAPFRNG